ncbi:flagellar assembly protein FliW [Endothiovibrio diazotrophicus]
MQISTTRFGEIEIDPDTVITFPDGIPGFEHCTRYKLLHEEGKPLIQWLQSLDDPDLTFSVVDPSAFNIFYEFAITEEQAAFIGLHETGEAAVFMLLYKPDENSANEEIDPVLRDNVRANASCPLVVNMRTLTGFQIRLKDPERETIIRERDH